MMMLEMTGMGLVLIENRVETRPWVQNVEKMWSDGETSSGVGIVVLARMDPWGLICFVHMMLMEQRTVRVVTNQVGIWPWFVSGNRQIISYSDAIFPESHWPLLWHPSTSNVFLSL